MHELGIALDIIDVASETLGDLGAVRVKSVRIRLGPLAGVVKQALMFSFDAAAAGTRLEHARLEIEDVAVAGWCDTCAAEREPADLAVRRCPVCQSLMARLLRGDELQVLALEIEDP